MPRLRSLRGRRLRPRIGALLAMVVFTPTAGMVALAVASVENRREERQVADHVRTESGSLAGLMAWRAALNDEWVLSSAVHAAASHGLSTDDVSAILGVDTAGDLEAARTEVDRGARAFAGTGFDPLVADLTDARAAVEAGDAAGRDAINVAFWELTGAVDTRWEAKLDGIRRVVASSTSSRRPGDLFVRLDALQRSFRVLVATMDRGDSAHLAITGTDGPETIASLLEATGRYEAATDGLVRTLGPRASAAWTAWRTDPSTRTAERLMGRIVTAFETGASVPALDVESYASILHDGVRWLDGVTHLTTSAALDLADLADERHRAATSSMVVMGAAAAVVAVAALVAGAALTRSVARPLRRLADFAHDVGEGDFDTTAPTPKGPRELARTTEAVADMASTVSAVESFVIQLAQDPASPALDVPLPGRTGRALQATVDQLRHSMQEAERHRKHLELVASQDGLTGLLNRTAAIDAIDRELARTRRSGEVFAIVFVDLDGLKQINDTYGHETGDEAIRRTAQALVTSTRRSDVVARLGGDEFLVALGAADGREEAARVAERIRRTVAEHPLALADGTLSLRCSIGVALAAPGDDAESVINHADKALYSAKAQGRNRICWFHTPDRGPVC